MITSQHKSTIPTIQFRSITLVDSYFFGKLGNMTISYNINDIVWLCLCMFCSLSLDTAKKVHGFTDRPGGLSTTAAIAIAKGGP